MPQDFIPDSEFVPDAPAQIPAPNQAAPTPATTPDFIPDDQFVSDEDKYNTPEQQLKGAAEGAAEVGTFGLSTGLEKGLHIATPEDIRGRSQNVGHTVGQGLGLIGSAFIPGLGEAEAINPLSASSLMHGLGEAAAKLGPEGEGIAASIARGGLKGAAETALFQGGDEISKALSGDPNSSLQNAAVNIGLAGLLGGGVGGTIGAISPLWKAANGTSLGKGIADFKGRIGEYLNDPNPAGTVTEELQNHYSTLR